LSVEAKAGYSAFGTAVDVNYSRYIPATEDSPPNNPPTAPRSQPSTYIIQETTRFRIDQKFSGHTYLTDLVVPSVVNIQILGGDGVPKLNAISESPPRRRRALRSLSLKMKPKLTVAVPQPDTPADTILRSAAFVSISAGVSAPCINFRNPKLLVAPVSFSDGAGTWKSLGFAEVFQMEDGPTTTSTSLIAPLPVGIGSLPWTPCRLAVDGSFTVPFAKNGYDAWVWLLSPGRLSSVLGVVVDNLSKPMDAVRSIMLPPFLALPDGRNAAPLPGCECDGTLKSTGTPPTVVSDNELAQNPGVYTEDPGSFCRPFQNPERVISERSFFSILRAEQPVISVEMSNNMRDAIVLDFEPSRTSTHAFEKITPLLTDFVGRSSSEKTNLATSTLDVNSPWRFGRSFTIPPQVYFPEMPPLLTGILARLNRGRKEMSAQDPLQWEAESLRYQASTVSRGHILEFTPGVRLIDGIEFEPKRL
jgi:hypothetical protein